MAWDLIGCTLLSNTFDFAFGPRFDRWRLRRERGLERSAANLFYRCPSIGTSLGLTGTFGVSLYTKTVVSGGDSWGRRNRTGAGPDTNYEALSDGAEGGTLVQLEGGIDCLRRGDRVRP